MMHLKTMQVFAIKIVKYRNNKIIQTYLAILGLFRKNMQMIKNPGPNYYLLTSISNVIG